jgi:hypothetical protein
VVVAAPERAAAVIRFQGKTSASLRLCVMPFFFPFLVAAAVEPSLL